MNRSAVLCNLLVTPVSAPAVATPGAASAQAEPTSRGCGLIIQAHLSGARVRLRDKLIAHPGPLASTTKACRKVGEGAWSR